jgi:hypothetical protein
MRNPKDDLRSQIERGKALRNEVETLLHDARMLNPRLAIGRTVLRLFEVGGRRDLVSLGRLLGAQGFVNRGNAMNQSFEQWYQGSLDRLRTISVATRNLTAQGNSGALVRRLARARKFKRLDTRIAHAVGELEAIAEEELVYNDDIPEFLKVRRVRALEERRWAREAKLLDLSSAMPGMESIELENREQLRTHFRGHDEVARMIEGALDASGSSGADADRQALASCRSAIEQAIFEATGEHNFRAGLAKLATGTRRRTIGDTYGFLSGYGSHPGGKPTKKDVSYGIRMTIASCSWILENSNP